MNGMQENLDDPLLDGFLDGELDSRQEELFYSELASNEELRAQLRELREIRSASRNYAAGLTPPAALTAATFARLGFAPPVASAEESTITTGFLSIFGSFVRRFRLPLGILTLIGTAGVLFFVLRSDDPVIPSSPKTGPIAGAVPQSGIPSSTAAPDVSNRTHTTGNISRTDNRIVTHSQTSRRLSAIKSADTPPAPIVHKPEGNAAKPESPSNLNEATIMMVDSSAAPPADFLPVQEDSRSMEPSIGADIQPQDDKAGAAFQLIGMPGATGPIRLEYRGSSLRSFPDATVPSRSSPWFREMSVAVLYRISDSHFIGLEGGQEAFPQHYSGIEMGKGVRYEQNLLTGWISAAYRTRLADFEFLGHLRPFLGVDLGATWEMWPLGKGIVGIDWSPVRRVSVIAGLEGMMLFYSFQDRWFTTKKAGLTYGISFAF